MKYFLDPQRVSAIHETKGWTVESSPWARVSLCIIVYHEKLMRQWHNHYWPLIVWMCVRIIQWYLFIFFLLSLNERHSRWNEFTLLFYWVWQWQFIHHLRNTHRECIGESVNLLSRREREKVSLSSLQWVTNSVISLSLSLVRNCSPVNGDNLRERSLHILTIQWKKKKSKLIDKVKTSGKFSLYFITHRYSV